MPVQTAKIIYTRLNHCSDSLSHPGLWHLHLPEKVAAEDETEHKDKEADAQHNDIHIEREVVDVRRHAAVVFRVLRTQTTQAPCKKEFAG